MGYGFIPVEGYIWEALALQIFTYYCSSPCHSAGKAGSCRSCVNMQPSADIQAETDLLLQQLWGHMHSSKAQTDSRTVTLLVCSLLKRLLLHRSCKGVYCCHQRMVSTAEHGAYLANDY